MESQWIAKVNRVIRSIQKEIEAADKADRIFCPKPRQERNEIARAIELQTCAVIFAPSELLRIRINRTGGIRPTEWFKRVMRSVRARSVCKLKCAAERIDEERARAARVGSCEGFVGIRARLKVTPSWVYEHTRSRGTPKSERLPHVKIGKYVRFDARVLRAFIEKKCRVA